MRFLIPFLLLVRLACCKSDNVPANSLIGTWRLTTYCKPVSATTCTTVNVPADKEVYVTFTTDGQFSETYGNTKYEGYGFMGCPGDYVVEGNDVRITTVCMSSLGGKLVEIVSLNSNQLVMNPYGTGEYIFVK